MTKQVHLRDHREYLARLASAGFIPDGCSWAEIKVSREGILIHYHNPADEHSPVLIEYPVKKQDHIDQ